MAGALAPPAAGDGDAAAARGVDPATGSAAVRAVDVTLPGTPPLVLRRHFHGRRRTGRWFGGSWGATLDRSLVLRADGVRLVTGDGGVLTYPVPEPGVAVLPLRGPRWPLCWDGARGGPMTVWRPESGSTLRFAPVPGAAGALLPLVEVTAADGWALRLGYGEDGAPAEVAHRDGHRVGVSARDGRIRELRLLSDGDGPLLCRYGYDAAGRLISVAGPDRPLETLGYDERGRLTRWTDEAGGGFGYTYDAADRIVAAEGRDGLRSAVFSYGAAGERWTVITDSLGHSTRYLFDERRRPVATTDPLEQTTRWEWDGAGRLLAVTDPLGRATRYRYDGRGLVEAVAFADGTVLGAEYDAGGRVTVLVEEDGTRRAPAAPRPEPAPEPDAPGDAAVTRDSEGRPVRVEGGHGNHWTYTYDAAGRLVEEADSRGASARYRYDGGGQRVGRTNSAGQRVSYTYDGRGRLAGLRSDTDIARFRYDPAGRPVSAANGETELGWEWDAAGRLAAETVNGRTVRFGYDEAGRPAERRTPSGAVTAVRYDDAGRPAEVRAGAFRLAFSYDAAGRECARRLGGEPGAVLRREWDAAGRPSALVLPSGERREYRHREDGAPVGAAGLALTLDAAGRVLAAEGPEGREEFRYDPDGGLAGGQGRYDGQGRLVQGAGGLGFSWDALDRLTDVVTGEGRHWHYVYDPLGRRVAKQLLDDYGAVVGQTVFVWEGTRLVEEIGEDGAVVTWHGVPGGDRPLARTAGDGGNGAAAVVTDPAGTPTDLLDAAGAPLWRRRTSFWGVPREGEGGGGPGCRLGFPGQYLDAETGLYYQVRRYYDPAAARFLSPDPRRLGPAPYAFVAHPWREVMPRGLPEGVAEPLPAAPEPGVNGRPW